jgi:hemerythrin-like domain-containing protein
MWRLRSTGRVDRSEDPVSGVITLIKDDHKKLESVFQELEKAEPDQIPALLKQVEELLVPHSQAEEQVVYPAIKSAVPDEGSDVDDGLAEHHHVEASLRELIASDPEAPGVDGLVAAMIGEVRHHVEEEEQEILPTFAEQVSNQELSELGERFTAAKEKAREQLRTRP